MKKSVISYSSKFARRKDFDVSPTSVEVVAKRNDVMELEDRAVGFLYGNINWVAGIEDIKAEDTSIERTIGYK